MYSVGRRTCALPYTSRPDEKRSRTRELPFLKRNVALWRVCLQPRTIASLSTSIGVRTCCQSGLARSGTVHDTCVEHMCAMSYVAMTNVEKCISSRLSSPRTRTATRPTTRGAANLRATGGPARRGRAIARRSSSARHTHTGGGVTRSETHTCAHCALRAQTRQCTAARNVRPTRRSRVRARVTARIPPTHDSNK